MIAEVIFAGLASLHELGTIYDGEGLEDLVELAAVKANNQMPDE